MNSRSQGPFRGNMFYGKRTRTSSQASLSLRTFQALLSVPKAVILLSVLVQIFGPRVHQKDVV